VVSWIVGGTLWLVLTTTILFVAMSSGVRHVVSYCRQRVCAVCRWRRCQLGFSATESVTTFVNGSSFPLLRSFHVAASPE
jgi:hypothetical protein